MKTTHHAAALNVLLILTSCALSHAQNPANPVPASNEQLTLLQGTWKGVELGNEAAGEATMTISGDAIDFIGGNKDEWYKATFTLPAGTEPRQLRSVVKACPAPELVGKISFAIYKIEDGTLTLVGNKPGNPAMPKGFDGDATSRTFTFKKAQPQKDSAAPAKAR
jgi:uncharacterized protein (TIGR03067 family)